jgi:hypothetical protein
VPPFDRVRVEDFKPALEAAMAECLAEIDAIAASPAAPTFENTVAAMERAGRALERASAIYGIYSGTMGTPDFQQVELEMEPKLAAFSDKIVQNEPLFKRLTSVYESRDAAGLTPEQKRLAWLKYTDFARSGARLGPRDKARLSEINQRLATLYTEFSQNVLADEASYILLEGEADLAGLSDALRSSAAAAAEGAGHKGKWAILNTRSSVEPFLTYSDRRDLREKVWRAFASRGDNNDSHDNKKNIAEIVRLRDERAKLLGYKSHAHWRLEMSMAKTPERATELMQALWKPAVARVAEEVADMQALADGLGHGIRIEAWDYRYYAEKVRKERYDLNEAEITRTCSSRSCARRCSGSRASSSASTSRRSTPCRSTTGCARVGGEGRQGQARRALLFRPLRAAAQAIGRVDERLPQPGALRGRSDDPRLQQLQLREGRPGRTRPGELGGRDHAVPRVRARAARPCVERDLPVARGHQRGPRLRGIPLAAPRKLAFDPGGAEPLRAPREDRRADPEGAGGEDRARLEVQQGLRERRVPLERAGGHAPAPRSRQGRGTSRPSSATRSPRSACLAR